jgi:Mannitol dehydrogenase C-terminal domain
MLNGSHSALAYLGYLAGHETIFDAVSDDLFARFVGRAGSPSRPVPGLQLGFRRAAVRMKNTHRSTHEELFQRSLSRQAAPIIAA